MHAREVQFEAAQLLRKPAAFAITFFVVAIGLLGIAAGTAWLVVQLAGQSASWNHTAFIVSFLTSTGLLLACSVQLVRASTFVRMERQPEFRRCLIAAVLIGTAFVTVQACGLHALITQQSVDLATGLKHAAFAFILLHAVHVVVALLFVVYVFLQALTDRYDHEYSWGVTFCGWFWHGLGVIWLAIMIAFLIAGSVVMVN